MTRLLIGFGIAALLIASVSGCSGSAKDQFEAKLVGLDDRVKSVLDPASETLLEWSYDIWETNSQVSPVMASLTIAIRFENREHKATTDEDVVFSFAFKDGTWVLDDIDCSADPMFATAKMLPGHKATEEVVRKQKQLNDAVEESRDRWGNLHALIDKGMHETPEEERARFAADERKQDADIDLKLAKVNASLDEAMAVAAVLGQAERFVDSDDSKAKQIAKLILGD